MDYKLSKHALLRLKARNISKENVFDVLHEPSSVIAQDESITVYSKLVNEGSKVYLYRVFVNTTKNPYLVITAYKTSKLEKYGN